MPRTRIDFKSLTLIEDEESGDTHMAIYATVIDSAGSTVAQFQWNNAGSKVDEVNIYSLNNDTGNNNVVYFELDTFGTVTINAFADDDQDWPTASSNENALGSVSATFDPRVPATLGSLFLGPSQTDNGNAGYLVDLEIAVVDAPVTANVRIDFENLVLFEDEESGDTHMAIYVRAKGSGIDQEIFRWNNDGSKVNEVASYNLDNAPGPTSVTLQLTGPTQIIVEGYADDDQDWPSSGSNENNLGSAVLTVDPADPSSAGQRQLGPTRTDNGNTGYVVNFSAEILPATPQPDLSIVSLEVTQAIQHHHSSLGADNSVPLVANKLTLVRAYIDSGVDPAINGGQVPNVTGILTVPGSPPANLPPIALFTAQPIASVDPTKFTDTLNFLIPADKCVGTLTLDVQATVGTNFSNVASVTVTFTPAAKLDIIMIRIRTATVSEPSRAQYFAAVNQLPLIYPIPSDPSAAITYWVDSGTEVYVNTHDLTTVKGMHDVLDDLEDIQEDGEDYQKLFGLVSNGVFMARTGTSRADDNVAFGLPLIMEAVGHELGHVYGLKHAPCGGPEDTDDDFVPSDGSIGDVGVDLVGQVAFASSTADIMSYCGDLGATNNEGEWISAYDWLKLYHRFTGR